MQMYFEIVETLNCEIFSSFLNISKIFIALDASCFILLTLYQIILELICELQAIFNYKKNNLIVSKLLLKIRDRHISCDNLFIIIFIYK